MLALAMLLLLFGVFLGVEAWSNLDLPLTAVDPTVFYHNGYYYIIHDGRILYNSTNLLDWSARYQIMNNNDKPDWMRFSGMSSMTYHYINGNLRYYTAYDPLDATERCIGVASPDNFYTGFKDGESNPKIVCKNGTYSGYPYVIQDPDTKDYYLFSGLALRSGRKS